MKKLLLLLLCVPLIGIGQQTYVPDDNFEQELINLGYDNILDDYVITSNISSIIYLDLEYKQIANLTGIEDFIMIEELNISENFISTIDLSNNLYLRELACHYNNLTSLDVSNNLLLIDLFCGSNPMGSLDVSNNIALTTLDCSELFNVTSLDVSNNIALIHLNCWWSGFQNLDVSNNTSLISLSLGDMSQLTNLDLRNGSNTNLSIFCENTPNLFCINVDDSTWSVNNWTVANGNIDPQHYFSDNCSGTTSIQEHTTNKELLKVTDLLGRETEKERNTPLFYIYNDGTVEKKMIIE